MARTSRFDGSNLVQRHFIWSYRPDQYLGEIDHNLRNHVLMTSYEKHPIQ